MRNQPAAPGSSIGCRRTKPWWGLLAAVAACAEPRARPPRGEVVFTVAGRVEAGPYRFGRDDLPHLPRRAFAARAPEPPSLDPSPLRGEGSEGGAHPAGAVSFQGADIYALLTNDVDVKDDADTAVFHGRSGYRAAIPTAVLRELRPALADRVGGGGVAAWRPEASPLVLAWPNVDAPGIDSDPRMRWWWVPGVTMVELVSWTATYGHALAVPRGASGDALLGAGPVATQCMGCHRVRGVGGTRGRELSSGDAKRDLEAFTASLRAHVETDGKPHAPDVSPATARQVQAFLRTLAFAPERSKEPEAPPRRSPSPPPVPPGPGGY